MKNVGELNFRFAKNGDILLRRKAGYRVSSKSQEMALIFLGCAEFISVICRILAHLCGTN